MIRKKGFVRLVMMIFLLLVLIVFVIQNPSLTKEVGKGLGKATAWIVNGGVNIYNNANISQKLNVSVDKNAK